MGAGNQQQRTAAEREQARLEREARRGRVVEPAAVEPAAGETAAIEVATGGSAQADVEPTQADVEPTQADVEPTQADAEPALVPIPVKLPPPAPLPPRLSPPRVSAT